MPAGPSRLTDLRWRAWDAMKEPIMLGVRPPLRLSLPGEMPPLASCFAADGGHLAGEWESGEPWGVEAAGSVPSSFQPLHF